MDDLLIKHKGQVVYRGETYFNVTILDDIRETWELFTKESIEKVLKVDYFYDEYLTPDSIILSKETNLEDVSIELVEHDSNLN